MLVEARSACRFEVRLLTHSRQRDELRASAPSGLTNPPSDLIAVDMRHVEIDECDVRSESLGHSKRLFTAVDCFYDTPLQTQQLGKRLRRIHVVVHDKDAAVRAIPRLRRRSTR